MARADEGATRGANRNRRPPRRTPPPKPPRSGGGGDTKSDLPSSPRVQPGRPTVTGGGDTKSAKDLGRAKTFAKSKKGRAAVRKTYEEQSHKRRSQIAKASKGRSGPAAAEVIRTHKERIRVQGYVDKAISASKWGNTPRPGTTKQDVTEIRKGLRVLRNQNEARLEQIARNQEIEYGQPKYSAPAPALDRDKGGGGLLGFVGRIGAGLASGSGGGRGVDTRAAAGRATAEKLGDNPIIDVSTKALSQLARGESAISTSALRADEEEGGGLARIGAAARGFVEGARDNEPKWERYFNEQLGLEGKGVGTAAFVTGAATDPLNALTLGFATPAAQAAKQGARVVNAGHRKAIRAAAKSGDAKAIEAARVAWRADMDDMLERASKLNDTQRGVQVGVRVPGRGPQVASGGKATAAVGKATARPRQAVRDSRVLSPFVEVGTKMSPNIRPQGRTRAEHKEWKDDVRRSNADRDNPAREGRELGKHIARSTKNDPAKMRQIVDAIEAGPEAVAKLPPKLRESAERTQDFYARTAARHEELTGEKLKLWDTLFPARDIDEVLGALKAIADTKQAKALKASTQAEKAVRKAAGKGKTADVRRGVSAEALIRAESVALRNLEEADALAARIEGIGKPLTREEERVFVAKAQGIIDDLKASAAKPAKADPADVQKLNFARIEADQLRETATKLRLDRKYDAARVADVRAAEAEEAVELLQRQVAEPDVQPGVLKGAAEDLERAVARMAERNDEEVPQGFVHRQTQESIDQRLEPGKDDVVRATGSGPNSPAGYESERLARGTRAQMREKGNDPYTDELPMLQALYGIDAGRRFGAISLWKRAIERSATPVTPETLGKVEGVVYRVNRKGYRKVDREAYDGMVSRVDPAEVELTQALGEEMDDLFIIPKELDDLLTEQGRRLEKNSGVQDLYDKGVRAFKIANTIFRPGFFATTLLGNSWQMFLADLSPADMLQSFRLFDALRLQTLEATNPGAAWRKAVLRATAGDKKFMVDGKMVSQAELIEEGSRAGILRMGSRTADPSELSLEKQAKMRLKKGSPVEFLGNIAEDLDDMTKGILYIRGRANGLTSKEAGEQALTKMIDYSDLSMTERRFFKRLMPFYVYTARNLPIQIKSNMARPGKLAQLERVKQQLAEASGLEPGWEGMRTEEEQERLPFPIPGLRGSRGYTEGPLKGQGFQAFVDLRLPVSDLAVPAQIAEGPGGAMRAGLRYAGGITPALKVPLEQILNRRLDYDMPIDQEKYRPPSGALHRLIGVLADDKKSVGLRTGEEYTGVHPRVDHAIRGLLGGPGTLASTIGQEVPDRSNLGEQKALTSFIAGLGLSASDPNYALRRGQQPRYEKLLGNRDRLERELGESKARGTEEYIRNEDAISELQDLITRIKAREGYPEARGRVPELDRRKIDRLMREPLELRALAVRDRQALRGLR